jgi:DNA-binding PucR family transcriptional regulator
MATQLERLYDEDFYAWTRDQARALRRLSDARWNGPLDLVHLAEEVEDLGTAARNAVRSQVERIIEHALKLAHSAAPEPRAGWMNSIDDARGRIEDMITATIRHDVEARLPRLFERARRKVVRELCAHGELDAAASLPKSCPYTPEDLLAEDWFPENTHGLSKAV